MGRRALFGLCAHSEVTQTPAALGTPGGTVMPFHVKVGRSDLVVVGYIV
jgi:hypothetical protein